MAASVSTNAIVAPVPPAGEDRPHVVFGTGQVGRVLAAMLADRGLKVRGGSRHRPAALADGIEGRAPGAGAPWRAWRPAEAGPAHPPPPHPPPPPPPARRR